MTSLFVSIYYVTIVEKRGVMRMRGKWKLFLGIIFIVVVAVFAIMNEGNVSVDYLLGHKKMPLNLIILGSACLGGIAVWMFGFIKQFKLQRRIKLLEKQLNQYKVEAPQT
jgi:putative membrane protein